MAKLIINENKKLGQINEEIYGHFAEHLGRCIYEGLYVGEDSEIPNVNGMRKDVVDALKEMKIPVLRWPGGCFADEYHWKDGIGPKENRKKMINTHWGGVLEDNSFGTHEFMELCGQLGCKTYVNGNVGSGTVQEMSEWVEYMTFDGVSPMADLRRKNGREKPWKIDYFGVGNENWGCGGNMTPEYYGNLYRRYQTYVRNYDNSNPIVKICCGANVDDYHWTERVLSTTHDQVQEGLHGLMDGLSLHYYVHPGGWDNKGSATRFDEKEWFLSMKKAWYMEELVKKHGDIMDKYDPEKKIGMIVDEWGCWFDVEPGTNPGFLYQQNTMRDALVACVTLNIFNKHCDRVKMANIAQLVNVLGSLLIEPKLLGEALRWRAELETVITAPGVPLPELPQGVRAVEVPDSLLASIADTETPQGIVFVCRGRPLALPPALEGRRYLILDGVQDPGNLGTIIRTCHWFGITTIFASLDTVDIYNPKTVQATMGSLGKVRVLYRDLEEIIASNPGVPVYGTLLEGESLYRVHPDRRGFIVMGNEGNGISENIRKLVDNPVTIPPYGHDHGESLNVAVATAITVAWFRKTDM